MCEKYLLSNYKDNIITILEDPDINKHFSVNVEFVELVGIDTALGQFFLEQPEKALEEWNSALKTVQTNIISNSEHDTYIYKNNIHCRMYKFPLYPDFHRNKFPQNEDTGKFLEVSGTVVRVAAIKMLEYQRKYICTKCKHIMTVDAQYELKNTIIPLKKCSNRDVCKSTNIVNLGELNTEFCKDYQEIKIQESVSKLDVGSIPNSMWVTLEDDLVDCCKPGDNITVCGFVKRRQNQFCIGKKMEIELVIKANHIHVDNTDSSSVSSNPKFKEMFEAFWKTYADQPLIARDIILKSICPQLFGLYIVKLAMAVVLAGGSNTNNYSNTGVSIRTEPHLLLVGDPGTGKSQLLRFASKIIPRSVLTTGVGSTAAGLTVAAVMENGDWQLEGGALVMSDGGICCIDEFNTMKEHDRTSIHEAMEQQTISVAKASIVCKLSTRCSILAATNPKGNLDPSQPLNMNIALASPLLSRFDLILLLRDRIDEEWDSQLTDYMFNAEESDLNWSVETLQAYYAFIKNLHPTLTEDTNKILSTYYQAQRRKNNRNKSRTTVRLLDSLVRLSQGHARLMAREEVQIIDAVTAIILVETGTDNDSSIFNLRFDVRNDFPTDPMENYKEIVEIVLKKLGLDNLLQKELDEINAKKTSQHNVPSKTHTSPKQKKESRFFNIQNKYKEIKINNIVDVEDRNTEETINKVETVIINKVETFAKKIDSNDGGGFRQPKNQKRQQSNHTTRTEKNVTVVEQRVVQNDLALLKCMPSINNKILSPNADLDHEPELFKISNNHENNDIYPSSVEKENLDDRYTRDTEEMNTDGNEELSQRTKTKNLFKKFRFVARDHPSTIENTILSPSDQSGTVHCNKSTNNIKNVSDIIVEKDESLNNFVGETKLTVTDFMDVSFKNVESSTQREVSARNAKNPFSIFENQGDVDDIDFDI